MIMKNISTLGKHCFSTSSTSPSIYGCFIGGIQEQNHVDALDRFFLDVSDKHSGKVAFQVAHTSNAQVSESIRIGREEGVRAMGELGNYQKKAILLELVDRLRDRESEFLQVMVTESGKPISDCRVEFDRALDTITVGAEESVRKYGEFSPADISERNAPYTMLTQRFPIGLISMISPFNFPLNLACHKVAPAIAAGCPFVLKPSERTPVTAIMLGEVLAEIKAMPKSGFSVVLPEHTQGGSSQLVDDERITCLSFTGSPGVGWALKKQAGHKKVLLELGGNAGLIVDGNMSDKQLDEAAARACLGAFTYAGQTCISVQRVYAHRSIYEKFKALLIKHTENTWLCNQGSPFDEQTKVGPLISANDAQRMQEWCDDAVSTHGATVLVGGKQHDRVFFDPTIIEHCPATHALNCKEAFGPVMTLQAFESFPEAIKLVNSSEFGLQTGVFTNDLNKAFYAYNHLEVGGVIINDIPTTRIDSQPYGGIKSSGIGREGLRDAIEEFQEKKVMVAKNLGVL